jgi:hypothetical protein
MVERKQHFCGDTLNLFAREDHNYHWSRSYWYYSTLPDKFNNNVWTYGIGLTGCVPEVFECKDIVTWFIDKFFQNIRNIPLQSNSPVSLAPSDIKKMLKLPEKKNNGTDLLQEYLQDPTTMSEDLSRIQVSYLNEPYQ